MPLTSAEDLNHLRAAEGYTELGMTKLGVDSLQLRVGIEIHLPEVLAARVEIYTGLKKWDHLQTVAARLATHDPNEAQWSISLAYATRRAQSIEAAKAILLEAVERHPNEPMLHYNLACYECQLGDVEVAKARLAHAFKLEPKCRLMALDDDDLEPLWAAL